MSELHMFLNLLDIKYLSFRPINTSRLNFDPPSFMLSNTPTVHSSQLKNLSVILNNKLSFLSYIQYTNIEAITLYNVMKQMPGNYLATPLKGSG